jgi:hypothetical protein
MCIQCFCMPLPCPFCFVSGFCFCLLPSFALALGAYASERGESSTDKGREAADRSETWSGDTHIAFWFRGLCLQKSSQRFIMAIVGWVTYNKTPLFFFFFLVISFVVYSSSSCSSSAACCYNYAVICSSTGPSSSYYHFDTLLMFSYRQMTHAPGQVAMDLTCRFKYCWCSWRREVQLCCCSYHQCLSFLSPPRIQSFV